MSDFEDELANDLYAFKMLLDARPNLPAKQIRQPWGSTRESSFDSQLRGPDHPRLASVPPVPPMALCGTGGGAPTSITFTTSGIFSIPDGEYTLSYSGGDGATFCEWSLGLPFGEFGPNGLVFSAEYSANGDDGGPGFFAVEVTNNNVATVFLSGGGGFQIGEAIPNTITTADGGGTVVIGLG